MASRLIIQNVTGTTPYDVYVCDLLEVLCSYVGVLSGTTLGQVFYLPSLYDTAPIIVAKLIDSNGCEVKKEIMCDENCTFQVVIYDQSGYPCLFTPTPTPNVTNTPTPSVTPTVTPTPSVTVTLTPTPSVTVTLTPTPSVTPTLTPTITPSSVDTFFILQENGDFILQENGDKIIWNPA
jgi:hypothetical protein